MCPNCSYALREQRLKESQLGPQITCRKCGHKISAKATVCPRCGVDFPKRSFNLVLAAIPVGAIILILVMMRLFPGDAAAPIPTETVQPVAGEPSESVPQQPEAVVEDRSDTPQPDSILRAPPVVADAPPSNTEPTTSSPSPNTRWTSTWVNVRSEPRPNGPRVQILDPGVRLEIGNYVAGFWEVFLNGRRLGYVANSLLLREPPES
jgi:hypothetical protein